MKKLCMYLSLVAVLAAFGLVAGADHHEGAWTGEVVDLACYVAHGDAGRGPDHAKCAKGCVKGGQPMGLLTDDGTLAERDGMKIVTVTGSKAAG